MSDAENNEDKSEPLHLRSEMEGKLNLGSFIVDPNFTDFVGTLRKLSFNKLISLNFINALKHCWIFQKKLNFIYLRKFFFILVFPKQVVPTVGYADENEFLPQWAIAVIVIGLASLLFVIIFGVTVVCINFKS